MKDYVREFKARMYEEPQQYGQALSGKGNVGLENIHPSLIDRIGGINDRNFGGGQGIQQLLDPLVRKIKQYQKSQATQNLEEQEQKLPPYLQEVEEITNATFPNVFSGGSGISGMNEFQPGPADRPLGQGIGSLSGFSDLFNQSPYNQNGGELFSQPVGGLFNQNGGGYNPFGNFDPQYFR
jgi:hypothetical protein